MRPSIISSTDAGSARSFDESTRDDGRENIKVLVRIRPLLAQEAGPSAVSCEGNVIRVEGPTGNRQLQCCYDAVIGPEVSQDGVFSYVRECATAVLEGENSTIFAYGQTGSGKTFTMFGQDVDANEAAKPAHNQGVIPLAVTDVFARLTRSGDKEYTFSVWVSMVQLYNEQLYDMLRDARRVHPLAIHEQPHGGIYVQGLSEYAVHDASECLQLLRVGRDHRAIRETHMNHSSSRSHSIFQIVVEQTRRSEQDGEYTLRSKFNLVDLAGSEKWDIRQDMEELRVSEMTNINVSLYTLGRVIAALSAPATSNEERSEKSRKTHVPYRDSKLTRLLQDSLGGNTRTRVIATLSPARECVDETISTLRFADRAKQVMACVHVNEHRPVNHALVRHLQAEVKHLRGLLDISEGGSVENRHPMNGAPRPLAVVKEPDEVQSEGYKEIVEKLRRENLFLRGNQLSKASTGSDHEVVASDTVAMQMARRMLEEAIRRIVDTARRFFRFEIEEEDLRNDLTQVIAKLSISVPGGMTWTGEELTLGTSPLGFGPGFDKRDRRGRDAHDPSQLEFIKDGGELMTGAGPPAAAVTTASEGGGYSGGEHQERIQGAVVSFPPVPGVTVHHEPRPETLAYRLRGKRADDLLVVMKKEVTEEEEERRLRLELRQAKERMKKNLQLQEWLLHKEQREMEVLANDSAARTRLDKDKRKKDEVFRRRAAKQKAKLRRFYETTQTAARTEAEQRDVVYLLGHHEKAAID